MNGSSQNKVVLDMLKKGYVTSFMAFREHGITRLSARIYDLRAQGYDIISVPRIAKNGGRYAAYYLKEDNEASKPL